MQQRNECFKPDPRRAALHLADLDTDAAHQALASDPAYDRWLDSMAELETERAGLSDWIGPNW